MANRRKFLAGLGALASGSAAAIGTGAFGSVEANRDVSVNVANDPNAFVGLDTPSEADFAESNGGTIEFNFNSESGASGNGLNANADTYMGPELTITNQGQDAFQLLIDPSGINSQLDTGSLSFYVHTNSYPDGDVRGEFGGTVSGSPPNNGNQGVILTPGASVTLGGAFRDITGDPTNVNFADADLTIYAITDESERFPESGPSDQSGDYPIVVNPGAGGDYSNGSPYDNSEFN
jgi:hypothetical protein